MNKRVMRASMAAVLEKQFVVYEVWRRLDAYESSRKAVFSNQEAAERAVKLLRQCDEMQANLPGSWEVREVNVNDAAEVLGEINWAFASAKKGKG